VRPDQDVKPRERCIFIVFIICRRWLPRFSAVTAVSPRRGQPSLHLINRAFQSAVCLAREEKSGAKFVFVLMYWRSDLLGGVQMIVFELNRAALRRIDGHSALKRRYEHSNQRFTTGIRERPISPVVEVLNLGSHRRLPGCSRLGTASTPFVPHRCMV
jgi:hypothetical protein